MKTFYSECRSSLIPKKSETGDDYSDRLCDFIGDLSDEDYKTFQRAFSDHCVAMAAGYSGIKLITRHLRTQL